eukprot:15366505-Ditylum_brightwellii.AAC.1
MGMPPVQLLTLFASREEKVLNLQLKLKSNIKDAVLYEVGGELQTSDISQKEDLINGSFSSPIC